MKNVLHIKMFDKIYSSAFSIVVFFLLISFVPSSVPSSMISLPAISANFPWRKNLIEAFTLLRFKTGDHVFNNAVVGKDGWIFYTGNRSVSKYQKVDPFSKKELSGLQKKLDRLNNDLKKKGITLLVVISPDKSTIYTRYMPNEIPVIGEKSQLDQFVEYMKTNGSTAILDLRQTLLDKSRSQEVYYKTDTHWNSIGAYYGYVLILHVLSLDFPNLQPRPLSDFEYTSAGETTKDISKLMGLLNYPEENWILVPKFELQLKVTKTATPDGAHYIRTVENSDSGLPRLLVFGDSFYNGLSQFIEPHFSRVKTIPFTQTRDTWSLDWIQQENPDIVIIEFVERYLDFSLPMLLED